MTPAVAVLMPTLGRKAWACEAVACALAQTVPPVEVFVLDDAMTPEGQPDRSLGLELPQSARTFVRYEWQPIGNLGVKRNYLACNAAPEADTFAIWDDDDWHHPQRLAVQLEALAAHPEADWCALAQRLLYDYNGRLWCRESLSRRHFFDGTMVIRRRAWRRLPSLQSGALYRFKDDIEAGRAALLTTRAALPLYLARVHPGNTTAKAVMQPGYLRVHDATPDDVRALRFDPMLIKSAALAATEREERRRHAP
jgi:glycosyltransferase involved in cell wall biosynthesis